MKMNICLASNDRYAPHAAALIASIRKFRTDGDEHVFHLLSDRLSEETKRKFRTMESDLDCRINIVDVDDKPFARWPAWRKSYAAYLRLVMGSVLPPDVGRVLYLDCDMIARTSLKPLFETDLTDKYAAVVAEGDASAPTFSYLHLTGRYFNSGMILFNLLKYREDRIEEKILDRGEELAGVLNFPDQDLLNEAFHDRVVFVPYSWNVNYCREARDHFLRIGFFGIYTPEEIEQATRSPKIVHYGGIKPWRMNCFHPFRQLYWDCQKTTPFFAEARSEYYRSFPKLLKTMLQSIFRFRVTKKWTYGKILGWTVYNSQPAYNGDPKTT